MKMEDARKIKALFVIAMINTVLLIGVIVNLNYGTLIQVTKNEKGENETVGQNYTYITGAVTRINSFVQNGNTRWMVEVAGSGKSNYFIAKAENLNLVILEVISDVKMDDNVTVMIDQKYNLYAIKINPE
jgi:hypothetical protein